MIILATFASVMTTIGYVILALLLLMLMIVIHEFGHYSAGKLLKFKINEFSIGFGPAIFEHKNKKNGEVFAIRPILLGGYCAFEGEDEDGNENPQAFNNQKPWKRIIVLFAGALFNFLSAIIIISIYFSCYGQMLPTVNKVYEGTQSFQEESFEVGDAILEVNGNLIHIVTEKDIYKSMKNTGETAEFKVLRNGKIIKIVCTKGDYKYTVKNQNTNKIEEKTNHGFGIQRSIKNVKLNYGLALGRAFPFCFYVVFQILISIGELFTGAIGIKNAGGPITVISTITQVSRHGFGQIMYLLVILSANLAVMNLLPLPALDGSRIVFAIIEWIRGKPVNRKVETIIHTVGLILLFSLTIILDIYHLV